MAPEHRDRDAVLRALLVARVHHAHPANAGDVVHPGRLSAALVTAVVLIFVVVASVVALRFGGGGGVPAAGGTSATAGASTPAAPSATPEDTLPAGKLLGRFASDDGPDQDHTIHPGKLAIATLFTCSGHGKYLVYVAGGTSESGDGDCSGGGVGSGKWDSQRYVFCEDQD